MIKQSELVELIPQALGGTHLRLPGRVVGKVWEWYDLPDGKMLFITTDRFAVFDRVLACVPYKGQVVNQLSAWWFAQTQDIIPNHILSIPDPNAAVVMQIEPFALEVLVRGYITGVTATALWHRYARGEREIYGYRFPDGLRKNQSLPEPIITPITKTPDGYDERLTIADVADRNILDANTWEQVQAASLALFKCGTQLSREAGLILVDTKYQFGRAPDGRLVLIDEIHTPDSSRFWQTEPYETSFAAGEEPENFDKELVRKAYVQRGYQGEGEPPVLSAQLWAATSQRYITIYEMLTGETFAPGEYPVEPRLVENLRNLKLR